jgi:hypothetical protein
VQFGRYVPTFRINFSVHLQNRLRRWSEEVPPKRRTVSTRLHEYGVISQQILFLAVTASITSNLSSRCESSCSVGQAAVFCVCGLVCLIFRGPSESRESLGQKHHCTRVHASRKYPFRARNTVYTFRQFDVRVKVPTRVSLCAVTVLHRA